MVETALAEADSATKTKGVVSRTLSGISTFVHNHAKVIAITVGSVAAAAGTILVLHKTGVDAKIAGKVKNTKVAQKLSDRKVTKKSDSEEESRAFQQIGGDDKVEAVKKASWLKSATAKLGKKNK